MYFPDLNTVFIHIPKSAGSSIRQALSCYSHWKSFRLVKGAYTPHDTIRQTIYKTEKEFLNDKFVFSVIRNPWDRIVSLYTMHQRLGNVDFGFRKFVIKLNKSKKGVKDIPRFYYKNQLHFLVDHDGNVVPKIYRFENLELAWQEICQTIGIENEPLIHKNNSQRSRSYHEYYDHVTKNIVYDWHEQDIEYFGFTFD